MEKLEVWVSLAGTLVSLSVALIIFLVRLVKSVRNNKNMLNENVLLDAVAPLMELAEKFTNYSGEEKKEFVLTKLNRFAIDNKLNFDAEAIAKKIEELISLTKQVNVVSNVGAIINLPEESCAALCDNAAQAQNNRKIILTNNKNN